MYAAAKENNMSHKIAPETAPQQKKKTAAPQNYFNFQNYSQNDIRVRYRPQNQTAPAVVQRKLSVTGVAPTADSRTLLSEAFTSANVFFYEQMIDFLVECAEEFEVPYAELNNFVLCIKNFLKTKMGKLREAFIQGHLGGVPPITPEFIKKRAGQDDLAYYGAGNSTPIDAYTADTIAIVGGGSKNTDPNYIARISELAKSTDSFKKQPPVRDYDLKGYVCCAIFSERALRKGELEAINKAKDKIKSMRAGTANYSNCGILVFQEFPVFQVLLQTFDINEVEAFAAQASGFDKLPEPPFAIGYNPMINSAEIKSCLAKYQKAEAAEPEEEDAGTETSDPYGGLFG